MKQSLIRVAAGLLLVAVIGLGVKLFAVASDIRRQSDLEEARPADVILVLGAAEYRGRPSPILEARLNHALFLYRQGLPPAALTHPGKGGGPPFSEGAVGRAYLTQHGVPPEAVVVER